MPVNMDPDTIKLIASIIVAVLIFSGAVLTFVNARLNEAKTEEARTSVVSWTLVAMICISSGVGFVLFFMFHSLWSEVFIAMALILILVQNIHGKFGVNWINITVFISVMVMEIPLALIFDLIDVLNTPSLATAKIRQFTTQPKVQNSRNLHSETPTAYLCAPHSEETTAPRSAPPKPRPAAKIGTHHLLAESSSIARL
jgi:hypothetical protein